MTELASSLTGKSHLTGVLEVFTKKRIKFSDVLPQKRVKSQMDMAAWEKSQAYYDLNNFINTISTSIQGQPVTAPIELNASTKNLMELLQKLDKLIEETPPIQQPQRFGNQAYRDWFKKMKENSHDYVRAVLPEQYHESVPEIAAYLADSFGNPTRIDYGTGHELAFIFFLVCLFKVGALAENDQVAVGLKVFNAYMNLVRKLQQVYRMEPAGSHGVWSLDDYQFVPFIWGSAQLAVNPPISPSQFLDEEKVKQYKDHYLFIACIDYIQKVKIGNFAEHSNQLWNISDVPSWAKISQGLMKMYQKEVLSKWPVIQHVLFGTLMPFDPVKPGTQLTTSRLGMRPPTSRPGAGDMKP